MLGPGRLECPARSRSAVAAALALSLAACSTGDRGPADDPSLRRLIPVEHRSLEQQDPADLFAVETVLEWKPGDGEDDPAWRLAGAAANRLDRRHGRMFLNCVKRPCWLAGETDLAATDVDVVEIEISGSNRIIGRLQWGVDGGDGNRDRALQERMISAADRSTLRFGVGRAPDWRGRITRLEIEPWAAERRIIEVLAIRASRYRLPPERRRRLVAEPWSVKLHGETRPGYLALAGHPVEWRVSIPPRANLRFGTAAPTLGQRPRRFEVVAHRGDTATSLFTTTQTADQGWRDHTVDLSSFGGREVTLEFRAEDPEDEPIHGFAAWSGPEVSVPPRRSRPNVVIISIDTLRVDHLSLAGHERPTTPEIDRFHTERGVWLRNAVTSAPWTLPAHVSMLTGIDALGHGVNHRSTIPASLPTLAATLRRHGYRTAAFTGGGWVSELFGFARGFDRYRSWPQGKARNLELRNHVDRILGWLPTAPEPFFLFLHTFEVHSPFDRQEPFQAEGVAALAPGTGFFDRAEPARREVAYAVEKHLLMGRTADRGRKVESAADWRHARAAYDNGIRYMDSQIGRLLRALAAIEPTIVVFTSDHGEAFGEHGLSSHGYLYDDNLLVPLVIAVPDESDPGRTVEQQVRLVDIVPTVLDYAGLPAPRGLDGRSLRRLLATGRDDTLPRVATSYASSSNYGLALRTANRLKYIFNNTPWPPVAGAEAVFDLTTDPAELEELTATLPAEDLDRLRDLARVALTLRPPYPALELRNEGPTPFEGELTGKCLHPLRTTSPDPAGARLEWVTGKRLSFSLPAGQAIELFFEAPNAPCVTVAGGPAGGPLLEATVDSPETAEAFGWSLAGGSFARIEDRHDLGVGFWWRPAASATVAADADLDDATRRQLEALGYLD